MRTVVTTSGLGRARAAARAVCREHQVAADRCDDLEIVLSELVSNACRHGAPPVLYEVVPDAGGLLVTVQDADPTPPTAGTAGLRGPAAEGGRGLDIVASLSRKWGWRPTAAGKTVWALV